MDLLTLLSALAAKGLRPTLAPEGLAILGPLARLTPELRAAVQQHQEPLSVLLGQGLSDLAFADSPAAAEGLAECQAFFEERAGHVASLAWPCPLPPPCRRCGSLAIRAAVIHAGESLRFDCGDCGAFKRFAVWLDRAEADEWIRAVAEAGTIQEASRPVAANAEAALTETP